MTGRVLVGRSLAEGEAAGEAVRLDQPLSLWGGMDPATGRVSDVHHPQAGADLAGRVVVMPSGRGSSSSSSVLAEAVRRGTAPAALVLAEPDPILVVGAVVARELYGRSVPVVVMGWEGLEEVRTGYRLRVEARDGRAVVRVEP